MPDTAFVTLHSLNKAGVNIVGVVPPPKSNPSYCGFTSFAKNLGYEIYDFEKKPDEPEFISNLKALRADLAVVTSYSLKFPRIFLETASDGFVNAHPALLPEYRGANPYSHVIMNGETQTGVTLHFMDEGFDTGDIILQRTLDIEPQETMGTLFNKLNFLTSQILVELLTYYEINGEFPRVKQPERARRTAPKILPDSPETRINWGRKAIDIERHIRALNPFLIASARFKGQFVKIFTAEASEFKSGETPGTIVSLGDTIDVATGFGVIKIKTIQLSNFIICDAADFCRRFLIHTGDKFE